MSENSQNQAKAQMESIIAMVAALNCDYDRLDELQEELVELLENVKDAELEDPESEEAVTAREELAAWKEENDEEYEDLKEAAGDCKDQDDARQRIEEDPLSIEVRSGWMTPGEQMEAEEFMILLCTGGPACRIVGELNQYKDPCRAWIEHQDWFEPWMEHHDENVDTDALLTYCQQFYFGG